MSIPAEILSLQIGHYEMLTGGGQLRSLSIREQRGSYECGKLEDGNVLWGHNIIKRANP